MSEEAEILTPENQNNGEPDVSQTDPSTVENASPTEEKSESRVQKRINQLTREKYDAQREKQELEQRVKDLESKIKPEPISAPKEDDFADYSEYQQKQAEYLAELAAQKVAKQQEEQQRALQQQEAQKVAQERTKKYVDRLQEEMSQYEGFAEKVNDPVFSGITQQMDPQLIGLIQDSDKSTALTYHLAANLDEADRISRLDPVLAARELALIEARIDVPQPKKVSDAPDPISPIGSSESAVQDPEKMSVDAWMEWRNKQIRG